MLDEGTSALDNITARAVMDALASIGRSVTVVVVAHRWTSVQNCDRIFVIDRGRGRCVGSGEFEELAKGNPIFQELMLSSRVSERRQARRITILHCSIVHTAIVNTSATNAWDK